MTRGNPYGRVVHSDATILAIRTAYQRHPVSKVQAMFPQVNARYVREICTGSVRPGVRPCPAGCAP